MRQPFSRVEDPFVLSLPSFVRTSPRCRCLSIVGYQYLLVTMKIHPVSPPPSKQVLAVGPSGDPKRLVPVRHLSARAKGTREAMIQRLDSSKNDASVRATKGFTHDVTDVCETSARRWRSDNEWKLFKTAGGSDAFQKCSCGIDDDPTTSRQQEVPGGHDLQMSGEGGARPCESTTVLQDATAQNQGNLPAVIDMMAPREGKVVSVADPGISPDRAATSTGATSSSCSFIKIMSLRKLNAKRRRQRCHHCPLLACALWENSSSRNRDYVCVDCQEEVYGGWPAPKDLLGKAYLTDAQIQAMIQKCSQRKEPCMPPTYIRP